MLNEAGSSGADYLQINNIGACKLYKALSNCRV